MNCNGKNIEKKIAITLNLVRFFLKTEGAGLNCSTFEINRASLAIQLVSA